MRGRVVKVTLTVFGAILLSTLGIFASDGLQNIDRNLVGLVGMNSSIGCPIGMVHVKKGESSFCIDMYEASPGADCPYASPGNIFETEENIGEKNCYPAAVSEAVPWRFVSLSQAERLCSRAGKRLPSSDEWHTAALGTLERECVTKASAAQETNEGRCSSDVGAYDMVGNVWEWVDETVTGNTYAGRHLPDEGFVSSVDASGVAITTAAEEQTLYGSDYFWSEQEGVFGMLRGGFYGSQEDAGVYAVNAAAPTTFATPGIGFRCVMDL